MVSSNKLCLPYLDCDESDESSKSASKMYFYARPLKMIHPWIS